MPEAVCPITKIRNIFNKNNPTIAIRTDGDAKPCVSGFKNEQTFCVYFRRSEVILSILQIGPMQAVLASSGRR